MSKEKAKKSTKEERTISFDSSDGGPLSKEELKSFLLTLRDKLSDSSAPPVYALGTMNFVLNSPNIYEILNDENKELARDIWLRIKQSGFHVAAPPMLFKADEIAAMN